MRRLLASGNAPILEQLARRRALLGFDFDGTLAPICADRARASMRPRTARLFRHVCELYPTVVISGRSAADVRERLGGAAVKRVVGNHGIDAGPGLAGLAREVSRALALVAAGLGDLPGLDIENKRLSLAVHYRRSPRKRAAKLAIARVVAALPMRIRLVPGKLVVNIVPARALHKGDALVLLRRRAHADVALYVGDDVTDEDVFALDQPGQLLSVRVGRSRSSRAELYLRDQREVDRLLERLVELRRS